MVEALEISWNIYRQAFQIPVLRVAIECVRSVVESRSSVFSPFEVQALRPGTLLLSFQGFLHIALS